MSTIGGASGGPAKCTRRLASVDADEDRPCGVEPALTQPGEQIGDHVRVLRGTLGQSERVLGAVDADTQGDHTQVIAEVHPVDYQRHQVQLTQRCGEQLAQRGLGRADEPARDRGLAPRHETRDNLVRVGVPRLLLCRLPISSSR